MLSMLTLVRGTIDASKSLRAVATLQRTAGAELLVLCSDPGPPFTLDQVEEARDVARRAYDFACGQDPDSRFKAAAGAVGDVLRKRSMFTDLCILSRGSGIGGGDLELLKTSLVDGATASAFVRGSNSATPDPSDHRETRAVAQA